MPLPQVFLVGAPKAGTAALYAALATHPEVDAPDPREPGHFLDHGSAGTGPGDGARHRLRVTDRHRYEALYAPSSAGVLRVDGSTLYLADRRAHVGIARAVPDARVVAVLRDPVERAYSHWAHLRSDGLEPVADFAAACGLEDERARQGFGPHWRYAGLGRYGEQLTHLYSVLDRTQVHLVRYADLVRAPVSTIDGICSFLGVAPGIVGPLTAENVRPLVPDTTRTRRWAAVVRTGAAVGGHLPAPLWHSLRRPVLDALRRDAAPRPPLATRVRRELIDRLADDMSVVERLTGWDLGDWRDEHGKGSFTTRRHTPRAQR